MTPEERAAQAAARAETVQTIDASTDVVESAFAFADDPDVPLSQQGSQLTAEEKKIAEAVDRKNGLMATEDEEWAAYVKSTGGDEADADDESGDSERSGADDEPEQTGEMPSLDVARALVTLAEAGASEESLAGLDPDRILLLASDLRKPETPEAPAPYKPSANVAKLKESLADDMSEESATALSNVMEGMDRDNQELRGMLASMHERAALDTVKLAYPAKQKELATPGVQKEIRSLGHTLWRAGMGQRYGDDMAGLEQAFMDAAKQQLGVPKKQRTKPAVVPQPAGRRRERMNTQKMSQADFDTECFKASQQGNTKRMEQLRQMRLDGKVGELVNPKLENTSSW